MPHITINASKELNKLLALDSIKLDLNDKRLVVLKILRKHYGLIKISG